MSVSIVVTMLGKRKASQSLSGRALSRRRTTTFVQKPYRRSKTRGVRGPMQAVIKQTLLRMAERKHVYVGHDKVELYHNSGSPASGRIIATPFVVDNQNCLPAQGTASNQRVGDSIYIEGVKLRLMFGQKSNRHNVSFRVLVIKHNPNNSPSSLNELIVPAALNILLDSPDPERGTVVVDKVIKHIIRPDLSGVGGADKEYTFTEEFYLPIKARAEFTSGTVAPDRKEHTVYVFAYDAYGTLQTDNIAYVQGSSQLIYRDP